MENYLLKFYVGFYFLLFVFKCIALDEELLIAQFLPDKSFSNASIIYGKNITCGKHRPAMYPSQTWTCNDIRVDGVRMAYGLYPGIGVDIRCTETQGFDELRQLCIKMMEFIASDRPLWGAFVSNATCNFLPENRVMLNMTKAGFEWHTMGPGRGWIETLQCMAESKQDEPNLL